MHWGQCWWPWFQSLLWTGWLQWDWCGNPWLHHVTVHNIYLGTGNRHFRHNSSSAMVWYIDMEVLWYISVSCCNLCLIMVLSWSTKFWLFLMWCWEFPSNGLRMLANSLATLYVTASLLETVGLKVMSFLWISHSP